MPSRHCGTSQTARLHGHLVRPEFDIADYILGVRLQ
jgi:hypothetical protein